MCVIASGILRTILRETMLLTTANHPYFIELCSKKEPENVSVPSKTQKDTDVWAMSASWWMSSGENPNKQSFCSSEPSVILKAFSSSDFDNEEPVNLVVQNCKRHLSGPDILGNKHCWLTRSFHSNLFGR